MNNEELYPHMHHLDDVCICTDPRCSGCSCGAGCAYAPGHENGTEATDPLGALIEAVSDFLADASDRDDDKVLPEQEGEYDGSLYPDYRRLSAALALAKKYHTSISHNEGPSCVLAETTTDNERVDGRCMVPHLDAQESDVVGYLLQGQFICRECVEDEFSGDMESFWADHPTPLTAEDVLRRGSPSCATCIKQVALLLDVANLLDEIEENKESSLVEIQREEQKDARANDTL